MTSLQGSMDIFSRLPILWKTLIIIGFITVFIVLTLMIVIISLISSSSQKIDTKANLDEYKDLLNEFDKNSKTENDESKNYPKLPKIKDLKGNLLKNLMTIEVL